MKNNTDKITVLELSYGLGLGGTERAMQEFALNLDKKKFNVIVGAYDISGPRKDILENKRIRVVKVSEESVRDIIQKNKIDVVHAHSAPITHFLGKVPLINEVVFSGNFSENADMNIIISKTLALKLNQIKTINYAKDYFVLYYPQNTESWLKYKMSSAKVASFKESLGLSKTDFVIGRVGRSEPSKTDFLLLKSAPFIAKKIKNVKFLFVGLPLLYRVLLLMKPSLAGKIIFLDETSDDKKLAQYYQALDIFWHTASRGETFGNVNAEAMIFEKPVVTHSTPFKGNSKSETLDNAQIELVDHMKTGMVASFPKDVAESFAFLHKHPAAKLAFGKSGKEKVLRMYDSKVVVRDFEKVVLQVLDSRKNNLSRNKSEFVNPSEQEIKHYFTKEYFHRMQSQVNTTTKLGKASYKLQKCAYLFLLEYPYLAVRLLLRKFGFNLEKARIFKK